MHQGLFSQDCRGSVGFAERGLMRAMRRSLSRVAHAHAPNPVLSGDFSDRGEDGFGFFFGDELAGAFDAEEREVGEAGAEYFDFFG